MSPFDLKQSNPLSPTTTEKSKLIFPCPPLFNSIYCFWYNFSLGKEGKL
uniref:Alternative protein TAF1 n=1 Tax=Homo sapiens TaxID=9606 RepID=L8EAA9_HUMAN|nr:alternative protein TAF1 [Homo sapiens]